MGAVLEPRPAMEPWFNVEVRRESAYVTATTYILAHYDQQDGKPMTDEGRAGAWQAIDEHTVGAPGTIEALVSALGQIMDHGAYKEWSTTDSDAPGASAKLVEGHLRVTVPHSHQYGEKGGVKEFATVEFGYEDVAPVLADLHRLSAS
ncbi:hypothetical protein ACFWAP_34940 [Streptomyces goshikiensis]|uniref:hypothetical protein n=1 Tax=Streptomyces goshikiensis TaxID=1942 RepID=UPI00364CDE2B